MEINRKKRILMVNDASCLHSGYGTYGRELLSRLDKTGKYEVGELACFSYVNDQRIPQDKITWYYYPNGVARSDDRFEQYQANESAKFGAWRFERVCLDFKPDIVFDIRDPWMYERICRSPARPYFHLTLMPTVDSAPQDAPWVHDISSADSVLSYTDYGTRTLKEESPDINVLASAPPGVDFDIYKPVFDKKRHKEAFGFPGDANIIGTVMRNQRRKLYPNLFKAFKKFLDLCYERGEKELAEKTWLLCHASWPDEGWNIPQLLKDHGVCGKVMFTYVCKHCKSIHVNTFCSAGYCTKCKKLSSVIPSTGFGLENTQLNDVINLFDLYVQYAVCEGFGMPQAEAAGCAVPIMSVDYSAMEDVLEYADGIAVPPQDFYKDLGTGSWRALPDDNIAAEKMFEFCLKPKSVQQRMGRKALEVAKEKWNWDNTAKIWESVFDNVELTGIQGQWDKPLPFKNQPPAWEQVKEQLSELSHDKFVRWCILNIAQDPKLINSHFEHQTITDLMYTRAVRNGGMLGRTQVNFEVVYNKFVMLQRNYEEVRWAIANQNNLKADDYIQFAHQRKAFLQ